MSLAIKYSIENRTAFLVLDEYLKKLFLENPPLTLQYDDYTFKYQGSEEVNYEGNFFDDIYLKVAIRKYLREKLVSQIEETSDFLEWDLLYEKVGSFTDDEEIRQGAKDYLNVCSKIFKEKGIDAMIIFLKSILRLKQS